ncbi:uncharacterized protein ASCRUDRAFT_71544 [Ascoidea rubescens DSM 1968]|uniref:Uncharacterized protein n=1 Tax=Ascoidea rubescens DSM 1968 TaxID=1344418 RepID=A0A1D2VDJ9_9ASCO|nr:hypothetical protein ASCRUDRAFT_71544 [Ascoidea rubescens DSM 1968]ODV59590.1 hypothetical protein ASCRUDRAFT_71544 [Ascoidea rubescens DSM 1968]
MSLIDAIGNLFESSLELDLKRIASMTSHALSQIHTIPIKKAIKQDIGADVQNNQHLIDIPENFNSQLLSLPDLKFLRDLLNNYNSILLELNSIEIPISYSETIDITDIVDQLDAVKLSIYNFNHLYLIINAEHTANYAYLSLKSVTTLVKTLLSKVLLLKNLISTFLSTLINQDLSFLQHLDFLAIYNINKNSNSMEIVIKNLVHLLDLQLIITNVNTNADTDPYLIDYSVNLWAIEILLDPIILNFVYHFFNDQNQALKLNNIHQPEIALNFIIKSFFSDSNLLNYLLKNFSCIIKSSYLNRNKRLDNINCKSIFLWEIFKVIIKLLKQKFLNDLSFNKLLIIANDEKNYKNIENRAFGHLIYELIEFDNYFNSEFNFLFLNINTSYKLSRNQVSFNEDNKWVGLTGEIFNNQDYFKQWIILESKFIKKRFNSIMSENYLKINYEIFKKSDLKTTYSSFSLYLLISNLFKKFFLNNNSLSFLIKTKIFVELILKNLLDNYIVNIILTKLIEFEKIKLSNSNIIGLSKIITSSFLKSKPADSNTDFNDKIHDDKDNDGNYKEKERMKDLNKKEENSFELKDDGTLEEIKLLCSLYGSLKYIKLNLKKLNESETVFGEIYTKVIQMNDLELRLTTEDEDGNLSEDHSEIENENYKETLDYNMDQSKITNYNNDFNDEKKIDYDEFFGKNKKNEKNKVIEYYFEKSLLKIDDLKLLIVTENIDEEFSENNLIKFESSILSNIIIKYDQLISRLLKDLDEFLKKILKIYLQDYLQKKWENEEVENDVFDTKNIKEIFYEAKKIEKFEDYIKVGLFKENRVISNKISNELIQPIYFLRLNLNFIRHLIGNKANFEDNKIESEIKIDLYDIKRRLIHNLKYYFIEYIFRIQVFSNNKRDRIFKCNRIKFDFLKLFEIIIDIFDSDINDLDENSMGKRNGKIDYRRKEMTSEIDHRKYEKYATNRDFCEVIDHCNILMIDEKSIREIFVDKDTDKDEEEYTDLFYRIRKDYTKYNAIRKYFNIKLLSDSEIFDLLSRKI